MFIVNLLVVQMVALNRVQALLGALIGEVIAEVTLLKRVLRLHQALEEWERESIRQLLAMKSRCVSTRSYTGSMCMHPTVRKWRRREGIADASHRPHWLHATLSTVQEQIVVALRQTLLLPLDDLLAVTREFIHPEVSRSGLNRCLRRHGKLMLGWPA